MYNSKLKTHTHTHTHKQTTHIHTGANTSFATRVLVDYGKGLYTQRKQIYLRCVFSTLALSLSLFDPLSLDLCCESRKRFSVL